MVFEETTGAFMYERIYRFNSTWKTTKEKCANSKCVWRIHVLVCALIWYWLHNFFKNQIPELLVPSLNVELLNNWGQISKIHTYFQTSPVLENFRPAFSPDPTDCPWVSEDATASRWRRKPWRGLLYSTLFSIGFYWLPHWISAGISSR